MSPLTWAMILLVAAFVLLVIEMFVPSHGAIGGIAAMCVIGAVIAGFYQGVGWGILMLAISAVSIPVAVWAVFSYWPQTPLGQRILIKLPESPEEVLPDSYRDTQSLIGKTGVAKTPMLLSGAIEIEGRTYDAVSEDLPIDQGDEVQVAAVKMNRVIVRRLDPSRPRDAQTPPVVRATAATAPAANEDDLLARAAASFGLDDLPELADGTGTPPQDEEESH